MRTIRLVLLGLWIPLGALAAPYPDSPALPPAWYTLPENAAADPGDARGTQPSLRFGRYLDALLAASARVTEQSQSLFERFDAGRHRDPGGTPWALEYLKTDLAVSATGLLGVLFLQGSPAVSLRWERVTPPAPNGGGRPAASDSRQIPTVLWIDEASTRADIDEQLGPFIAMIAGSGKVKDPVLFHDQLLYRADQFQQYARAMEGAMGDQWWASGFRAELDVDVSGMVSPAVSVGGQLTIRFEWDRLTCTSAPRDPLPPGLQSLEDLVQAIAEDLDTVSQDVFTGTGYVPHGINVTLG